MESIKDFLKEFDGYIDYEMIHQNSAMKKSLYSLIQIEKEETPFDYFETLSLDEKGEVHSTIFIEPVGTVSFSASSLDEFFIGINHLFNSQPDNMGYALAGHTIAAYSREVRKGMGINFRYLDTNVLWNIDINKEEIQRNILFSDIKTGRDLFDFMKQKNRVNFVVTDDICFFTSGIADLMLGEIIYVEEQMPDFFKLLIDLSKFDSHNQEIISLSGYSNTFKEMYPKNGILEYYFPFESEINDDVGFQLIKEEDISYYKQEAKHFWQLNFDGSYQEYKEK